MAKVQGTSRLILPFKKGTLKFIKSERFGSCLGADDLELKS